ncbi:MAG TPA: hypothetical protein VGK74_07785 [Symbiobacteriaceae bacterium]|jgi:hypothetical protein
MRRFISGILIVTLFVVAATSESFAASAGLYWGPVTVGNLKLYLTNPHVGYAGPKVGTVNHTNFHVDKQSAPVFVPVANFHITKYQRGSTSCLYVWESESSKVVFDKCTGNWKDVAGQAIQAMKDFTKTLLRNADWLAYLIIVGVLTVALLGLIVTAAPVVILSEPPDGGSKAPAGPPKSAGLDSARGDGTESTQQRHQ